MKNESINIIKNAEIGISKLPPATCQEVSESEIAMQKSIPSDLSYFYLNISNGIEFGRLRIIPVLSINNLKKTGDSIVRNNSLNHSIWFNNDEASINEFLVFCTEGSHRCFAFKNNSEFIWQWNRGDERVVELDYTFWSWLHESLMQEKYYLSN